MTSPRSSILIPSFGRPDALRKCLAALDRQTTPADEIIVVWQANDHPTRDAAQSVRSVRAIHSETRGVVPAENAALDASSGEVILLIDDDAIAPPDWVQRHLKHYEDPSVGAVGGPATNFHPDGTIFPARSVEPVGKLSWSGRTHGNMHDHPPEWRRRAPEQVDHLVGYNMSLRRSAFDRFEENLRPYWQMFEMDACLQAKSRGFRVLFDFANVVEHHPTNTAYVSGRGGDLQIKVYNAAYNHSYILAKHRRSALHGIAQRANAFGVGTMNSPGLLAATLGSMRYGHPARELSIMWKTWKCRRAAERDARRDRRSQRK
jgi:glycosyltransferase involved in cell wall biosynthesis